MDFVNEEAVLKLAVIAEAFPVIGQQKDGGALVEIARPQVSRQATDDLVGICDLTIAWRVDGKPRRRRIRFVRLA